jgi:Cep192 domain 4/Abnormal spindle-like microcephaly-assoc'd, ASPM-SPD-2-Hydin/HYDIN/CFA65/VesB-like, Ig-like domain
VKSKSCSIQRSRGFRKRLGVTVGSVLFFCFSCTSLLASNQFRHVSSSSGGLNFGSIAVGTASTQTVAITNSWRQTITLSSAVVTGEGFSYTGPALPVTLAGGQSVNLSVTFSPSVTGSVTGTLSVAENKGWASSTQVIQLTGSGFQSSTPNQPPTSSQGSASLSASPGSVSFGNVLVGTSSSQAVSLLNSGASSLTISQATISGNGLSVSGLPLPQTLGPGQSTSFAIVFSPATTGSVTSSLSVASDATNSSLLIPVSATGVQPLISISPSSVSFGSLTIGLTNTQMITVTNPGSANLSVTQEAGPSPGFSLSGLTFPLTIAPGKSSSFTVGFSPTTSGTLSSSITLVSNAPTSPSLLTLSGSGVSPILQLSASPVSLDFGSAPLGSTNTQNVTLTNTGNSSISVSQISANGSGFTENGLGIPVTLSPGQSASFSVVFAPTVSGSATGAVSVVSTATNSPLSIPLSGSGSQATHSVTLTWSPSSSVVVGYYVYSSTQSGQGFSRLNSTPVASTTYDDNTVQSGTTYYYYVTAVDSAGGESQPSNQASVTVP